MHRYEKSLLLSLCGKLISFALVLLCLSVFVSSSQAGGRPMPNVQALPLEKLPALSFWKSEYGEKANALLAAVKPGAVIDITNKVHGSQDPWPIIAEVVCGHDEDCVAPSETIFHLVRPLSDWPFEQVSVRSRGEIAADFPTGEDGEVVRQYVILSGPSYSIIEGVLSQNRDSDTAALAFRMEVEILHPESFEAEIVGALKGAARRVKDKGLR